MPRAKVHVFDTTGIDGERLGQYYGIRRKVTRTIRGQKYTMAIYGAYGAMGLIGSERNGIVVLNMTRMCVVTDAIMEDPRGTGWFGASDGQVRLFDEVAASSSAMFLKFMRYSVKFRGDHTMR